MNRIPLPTAVVLAALFAPSPTVAQIPADDLESGDLEVAEDSLEARVWLDRGDEPVVEQGDEIRVYYRTSADAFAAIFRIDTDGRISLVFPQHPDVDPYVGGGRDYRLLFPDSPRWKVRDDPGMGYFFMIASPVPFDFSALGYDVEGGWDLSGVGSTVYEDPYVAIDDYVAAILPNWASTPYALDFLSYSVGEARQYPRFLCYDCHDYRSYARWNPYADLCTTYTVVVWDDPYFLPRYRYVGTRIVFARPLGPRPRYGITARVAGLGWGPVVRTRPAPPRRVASYKEPARRIPPPLRRPSARIGNRPDGFAAPAVGGRAGARVTPPRASERPSATAAPRSGSAERARPTLQRRPSGRALSRPMSRPPSTAAPRPAPTVRTPPRGTPRPAPGGIGVPPRGRPDVGPPPRGARVPERPVRARPPNGGGATGQPPARPPARAAPPRSGGDGATRRPTRPRRRPGG